MPPPSPDYTRYIQQLQQIALLLHVWESRRVVA